MGHHEEFEHEHEHTHVAADGTTYTHSHPHTHEDHDHEDHNHSHEETAASSLDETKALLGYMIHHNEHHAEELANLMDSLPETAQKKLRTAIGTFEAANVELQEVLDCL